jgi:hypothetical protein
MRSIRAPCIDTLIFLLGIATVHVAVGFNIVDVKFLDYF